MPEEINWTNVVDCLHRYGVTRDRVLGERTFRFLYVELARVVPEHNHDALQTVLLKLHTCPTKLGAAVKSPKAWLRKAVRNKVLDEQKATIAGREREENWLTTHLTDIEDQRSISNAMLPVRDCLEKLTLKRRLVLKLYYLDSAITGEEISYLGQVHECDQNVIRSRIDGVVDAEDSLNRSYQLSLIIEPDKGSSDAEARERRLDRFRKARKTAENELKACLGVQV
ncbi:sigma-70 family RNA polymerase sigma factor [Microvenator marinus]|uniref:Sigma-70 family RNA polymerase sigma factor n=1 Tax=Microvenator marinus TaxID=2600177 RepID=A0A5B8XXR2_9DELT|nr:sigma-70 family RNA polymerase sigma factor [Microvenator marinus]QED29961.1 sigma-70 family RNA polymerase sigma factor [Microvenator marinus]